MIYAGNMTKSEAEKYRDARFTHTEIRNGRAVDMYDCWTHEDEDRPIFGDELNIEKVKKVDSAIRIITDLNEGLGETINIDNQ